MRFCYFGAEEESVVMLCICFVLPQCLKFKTDQAQDAKKMEKLNNIFFTLMARGPDGINWIYYSTLN